MMKCDDDVDDEDDYDGDDNDDSHGGSDLLK